MGDPSNEFSVLLRFARWDEVLTHEQPPGNLPADVRNADVMRGYWHYARGMGLSATGLILGTAVMGLARLRKGKKTTAV